MLEKIGKALKKNYKFIILLICVVIFIAIIEDIFEKETMTIDLLIYKIIVQNMRNDVLTSIFKVITNFGGAYCLILIATLSAIFIKDKK